MPNPKIALVFVLMLLFLLSNESAPKSKVVAKYSDRKGAEDLINHINQFAIKFIAHMKRKFMNPGGALSADPYYIKGRTLMQNMLDRFRSSALSENEPTSPNMVSFTLNKGEMITLCLREQETQLHKLHDQHTIEFVFLHELTHLSDPVYDPEHKYMSFWKTFKFLLAEAKEAGLHEPRDYSQSPIKYCSLNIRYNPYFDTNFGFI